MIRITQKICFGVIFLFIGHFKGFAQDSICEVSNITKNLDPDYIWSPDHKRYLLNKQDNKGVFQIYLGDSGQNNPICISLVNQTRARRSWKQRNKLQVQWHPSGKFIICAVEKDFYNEVIYVPYSLRLGWLQSGLWMDLWALNPDGLKWFPLSFTEHGFTGPAFTPDGKTAVYAEAMNHANLKRNAFGKWRLLSADFTIVQDTPSTQGIHDITPPGASWVEPGNFSPDGHSLLISADIGLTDAQGQDQFILDISSGKTINLTNSPSVWDEHGIFSPDGSKILFMSSYPYQNENASHVLNLKTEFMMMNKDGSGLQQLTHFRTSGFAEFSRGIAATGKWSLDGNRIYLQSLIFPNYENWKLTFNRPCGILTK